jgi:hypothetical protein
MNFLVFLLLVASAVPDGSEINYETARHERKLKAVKITEEIAIDGRLEEPAWSAAPVATDFIQNEPRPNEPASEPTEARMLYDEDSIYLGFYMRDSRLDGLVINELKKDFGTNDGDVIEVILDTFHDERNGYMFSTNAAGAKYDAQMINEGREINSSWDGIWYVKTSRVGDGWIAEMAIPLKTLKFRTSDVQTWGVNYHRNLRSDGRNEDSFWSPLPRIYGLNRVSLAGTVEDLEGIKPGVNLKLKPYVTASLSRKADEDYKGDADFGFDAKYGLTTGITWDFTYNTDFSQVEADQQQINLTRFDLFFPEKRDFFLENSGIFQFGPGESMGNLADFGGAPSGGASAYGLAENDLIFFFSRRIGLSDDGEAIPILGGTRLTGRAGGWELGFLDMQQEDYGETRATNFAVGRLRRNVLANSDIGIMMNNKEMEGSHYNRVLGGDANFRFGQAVSAHAFLVKSFSPLAGKDSDNMAARAGFEYKDRTYNFRMSYLDIQENFTDEMGFVPRTGIRKFTGYPEYTWRPESTRNVVRSFTPHVHFEYILDPQSRMDTREVKYHFAARFQDGSFLEPGIDQKFERVPAPFIISNAYGIWIPAGLYNNDEYFVLGMSDRSRRLSGNGRYGLGKFYGGYKHSYQLGANYRVNYKINASASYMHNNISLPQPNGHFKTHLLAMRLNYSFSTTVFLNALVQYNSDAREWSSNIRFNIIHHPLSDLFVVYNERRNSQTGDLVDRAMILKLTYMFAR